MNIILKKHMSAAAVIVFLMLVILLAFMLMSCSGKRYHVDYGGEKAFYKGAKDTYKAGEKVTLYYELILTDTDMSFYLDGEYLNTFYDEKKGIGISFIMPEHDVKLECRTRNSMIGVEIPNPILDASMKELGDELGYYFDLPKEQFHELTVTRFDLSRVMYEISFVYEDGNPYIFRIKDGKEDMDILGMYYTWKETYAGAEDAYTVCLDNDGHGICNWQETSATCCVIMEENADRERLENMRHCIMQACENLD